MRDLIPRYETWCASEFLNHEFADDRRPRSDFHWPVQKSDEDVLSLLLQRQKDALNATETAIPEIAKAAEALQTVTVSGGKIGYAGAGSAGLTALADCLELPGTFGFPVERMRMLYAGVLQTCFTLPAHMRTTKKPASLTFKNQALEKEIS